MDKLYLLVMVAVVVAMIGISGCTSVRTPVSSPEFMEPDISTHATITPREEPPLVEPLVDVEQYLSLEERFITPEELRVQPVVLLATGYPTKSTLSVVFRGTTGEDYEFSFSSPGPRLTQPLPAGNYFIQAFVLENGVWKKEQEGEFTVFSFFGGKRNEYTIIKKEVKKGGEK